MSITKTLGGDRLGSGDKMKVAMHGYERSTHDLSSVLRTTISAGTLVPVYFQPTIPGDEWDMSLGMEILTLPTNGPLFGSMKAELSVFIADTRLYHGWLHNNKLRVGLDMARVKLPLMTMEAPLLQATTLGAINVDNLQINPSSIFKYIGLSGIGWRANGPGAPGERDFPALELLTYWDTYKNYYANKQENIGVVIHSEGEEPVKFVNKIEMAASGTVIPMVPATPGMLPIYYGQRIDVALSTAGQPLNQIIMILSTGEEVPLSNLGTIIEIAPDGLSVGVEYRYTNVGAVRFITSWRYVEPEDLVTKEVKLETFPLENIDKMREAILGHTTNSSPFYVTSQNYAPYNLPFKQTASGFRSMMESQEGLAVKTYQSDVFNNWLDKELIDGAGGITELTSVAVEDGKFTIDDLNFSNKLYNLLNRILVSGGSYYDYIETVYDVTSYTKPEIPVYCGGLIKELVFQEVVSSVEGAPDAGGQPQGTLTGRGRFNDKHKGGNVVIKAKEFGTVMVLASITPRVGYYQGNAWYTGLKTMADYHVPEMDGIGFQNLSNETMAWWEAYGDIDGNWSAATAGKQPAWTWYMTNYDRVAGNFAIENNSMWMVLVKRFKAKPVLDNYTIGNLTTYIDPRDVNHIFAESALDAMNFWLHVSVDAKVRRKMSAKLMPNM